jgi:hypothetical protein
MQIKEYVASTGPLILAIVFSVLCLFAPFSIVFLANSLLDANIGYSIETWILSAVLITIIT